MVGFLPLFVVRLRRVGLQQVLDRAAWRVQCEALVRVTVRVRVRVRVKVRVRVIFRASASARVGFRIRARARIGLQARVRLKRGSARGSARVRVWSFAGVT